MLPLLKWSAACDVCQGNFSFQGYLNTQLLLWDKGKDPWICHMRRGFLCFIFHSFLCFFVLQVSSNTRMNLLSLETELFVWWRCVLCDSLWRVILSAGDAWGTHLGLYVPCPEPVSWLDQALEVVLMISRCTSATTIREVWKTRLITQSPGGKERERGPGVLPRTLGFWGFTLYW